MFVRSEVVTFRAQTHPGGWFHHARRRWLGQNSPPAHVRCGRYRANGYRAGAPIRRPPIIRAQGRGV